MIIVVDDRVTVTDAYRSSFAREGVAATGFSASDFRGWVAAAADDDVNAIDAVLIGACDESRRLAQIIKSRCSAAVIAMREDRSLSSTLELFAEGMDDVVSKPCHVREILARVEAICRRVRATDLSAGDGADIRIFRDGREPLIAGTTISMPRRELRILEFLVNSRSRWVTKTQIFSAVYGIFNDEIDESVIESHICKLRRRLRQRLGYDPVQSRRHLGYCLIDAGEFCRPRSLAKAEMSARPPARLA